jgi:hypothetical protein
VRESKIDVTYEIEVTDDLSALADPAFHRAAIEHMRTKAEALAAQAGGFVRTDRTPEISFPRVASPASPLMSGQFVLYASRWYVDVPETFHEDGK